MGISIALDDFPNADAAISESTIQLVASSVECQCSATISTLSVSGNFNDVIKSDEWLFVFFIFRDLPDSDFVFGGGSNPGLILMEGNLVNGGTSFEFVLGFLEVSDIPDVDFLVLTSSDDKFTIRGDSNSVNV